jgi:hypothetical protein
VAHPHAQVPLCVSCPPHGGVQVWNLLTSECIHTLHASDVPERMVAVAFSPDGMVRGRPLLSKATCLLAERFTRSQSSAA